MELLVVTPWVRAAGLKFRTGIERFPWMRARLLVVKTSQPGQHRSRLGMTLSDRLALQAQRPACQAYHVKHSMMAFAPGGPSSITFRR
jgi:hypothetical protein